MIRAIYCLLVLIVAASGGNAWAFQLAAYKWPAPSTSFHVDIPGPENAPSIWNAAFEEAMNRWNAATSFNFAIVRNSFADPCQREGRNGVAFRSDICGAAFGASTLAVTTTLFTLSGEAIESDIIFDRNKTWSVYSGALMPGVNDFRRVAVHELGHVMGLNHEDSVPAIMQTFQSNLEIPQSDDIAGVQAIYDGSAPPPSGNCPPPTPLALNTSTVDMLTGDCTIQGLLGANDVSAVKQYSVTLPAAGRLTVRMESTDFDSFLWLLDESRTTVIAIDDDSGGALNSLIDVNLAPGKYIVLANTVGTAQTLTGTFTLAATFTSTQASDLAAAVLPSSRSVQIGNTATAFATIINSGAAVASGCRIAPATAFAATFAFRTTDPLTNQATGALNDPATIAPGTSQSFAIYLTPTAPFAPSEVAFSFVCDGRVPAAPITGVNTLLLSASQSAVPDVVALAATLGNDGVVNIPRATGTGVFAVATANVGSSGAITVTTDTGGLSVPVDITLCQTDPASGGCISPISHSVTTVIGANATPTFAFFVKSSDTIGFDPANNRIFVRFRDGLGVTRGSTSVAVRTQ